MSVRSMSAGVKRVLVIVDEVYLTPLGLNTKSPTGKNQEKGLLEGIFGF